MHTLHDAPPTTPKHHHHDKPPQPHYGGFEPVQNHGGPTTLYPLSWIEPPNMCLKASPRPSSFWLVFYIITWSLPGLSSFYIFQFEILFFSLQNQNTQKCFTVSEALKTFGIPSPAILLFPPFSVLAAFLQSVSYTASRVLDSESRVRGRCFACFPNT